MNLCHQVGAQRLMHRAVAGQTRLARKGGRANDNVEMALSSFLMAGMTTVTFAIVTDR